MKKKQKSITKPLGYVRDKMIADGAYDGRFRSKTYVDRKREANRMACRNKDI